MDENCLSVKILKVFQWPKEVCPLLHLFIYSFMHACIHSSHNLTIADGVLYVPGPLLGFGKFKKNKEVPLPLIHLCSSLEASANK